MGHECWTDKNMDIPDIFPVYNGWNCRYPISPVSRLIIQPWPIILLLVVSNYLFHYFNTSGDSNFNRTELYILPRLNYILIKVLCPLPQTVRNGENISYLKFCVNFDRKFLNKFVILFNVSFHTAQDYRIWAALAMNHDSGLLCFISCCRIHLRLKTSRENSNYKVLVRYLWSRKIHIPIVRSSNYLHHQ